MNPVTLQINIAPGDYKHSKYLLEHQISVFHEQVGEILLTYDNNPKKILSDNEINKFHLPFMELIEDLKSQYPAIRFIQTSYKKSDKDEVNKEYFDRSIPTHDFRGAPIYPYLYGFYHSKYDYVFHIDSDMFFGGLSQNWIDEALELFNNDPEVMFASPLPGPPHPNGILINQPDYSQYNGEKYSFEIPGLLSTRICMFKKEDLRHSLKKIRPSFTESIVAYFEGFPRINRLEHILYINMSEKKKKRVDFLGSAPGMWAIHPNYRSDEFYRQIPDMINRLKEMRDIPEDQYGNYAFSMNFIDWTQAVQNFENNRFRTKVLRKLGLKKI